MSDASLLPTTVQFFRSGTGRGDKYFRGLWPAERLYLIHQIPSRRTSGNSGANIITFSYLVKQIGSGTSRITLG